MIGNGTTTGVGEVQVGTRWLRQGEGIDGGHAGNETYNKFGIGICLVGEFNASAPSAGQLAALRQLCRALMKRYDIPKSRVLPHRAVRKGGTDCPGKRFQVKAFRSSL